MPQQTVAQSSLFTLLSRSRPTPEQLGPRRPRVAPKRQGARLLAGVRVLRPLDVQPAGGHPPTPSPSNIPRAHVPTAGATRFHLRSPTRCHLCSPARFHPRYPTHVSRGNGRRAASRTRRTCCSRPTTRTRAGASRRTAASRTCSCCSSGWPGRNRRQDTSRVAHMAPCFPQAKGALRFARWRGAPPSCPRAAPAPACGSAASACT